MAGLDGDWSCCGGKREEEQEEGVSLPPLS